MLIIDSHLHAGLNWFSPIETLLHEMDTNGVSHSVLAQAGGSYDSSYLFECDKRFPGRFKIAVVVDPQDSKPEAMLETLKNRGAAGVRLRPDSKYKTPDPYAMWKTAGELGLIVSVRTAEGAAEYLGTTFKKILDACPNTHMQLEHLAGVGYSKPPYDTYKAALECAQWPNTSIKVPGLGEIIERPAVLPPGYPFTSFPPLFEMALAAFGPQRMVWGSDYPAGSREGYRNSLEGVRNYPAFQKAGIVDWILGKTAAKIWGFSV